MRVNISLIPLSICLTALSTTLNIASAEVRAEAYGKAAAETTVPDIRKSDLKRYVERLTSNEFAGRGTGDPGERMATAYYASFIKQLELSPFGPQDSYYQEFKYPNGQKLTGNNSLTIFAPDQSKREFSPGEAYQPLSISQSKLIDAEIVFAGFGIDHKDYNSFEGIDVTGKWQLVLRGIPDNRKDLRAYTTLYRKARIAKAKGAAGIIYIKAANPNVSAELINPSQSIGPIANCIPSLTISDRLATSLFKGSRLDTLDLAAIFKAYSTGETVKGFSIPTRARGQVSLEPDYLVGRNVIGRLMIGEQPSDQAIVIGGHIDHLGYGNRGTSIARGRAATQLHPGADDNASGTAVIMELAQYFSNLKRHGILNLDRDLIFAAWSGEEVGLYGSRHFVRQLRIRHDKKIYPQIASYINLDMVGRASSHRGLTLEGATSSDDWLAVIDSTPRIEGLNIKLGDNPNRPADSQPFYQAGVPIISAFTGLHKDYHTPRDTIDKIDFDGLRNITRYIKDLTTELATRAEPPSYRFVFPKQSRKARLGIMISSDNDGAWVKKVGEGSPAERAGILVGDRITRFNQTVISHQATLLQQLDKVTKSGHYPITVNRNGKSIELSAPLKAP